MIRQATRRAITAVLVSLAIFALAACSSAASSPAASSPAAGGIVASGAWARPSTGMDLAGAVYLTLTNSGASSDALVSVTSAAATTCELHETMAGSSGMMAMQPVAKIEIPMNGSVELKPGGFHIMLIGLKQDLTAGTSIQLTLTFEKAAPITVTAEVRAG